MVAVLNPDFAAASEELFCLDDARQVIGRRGTFGLIAVVRGRWFRLHAAAVGKWCAVLLVSWQFFATSNFLRVIRGFRRMQ
jgi:hypothetical protein